MTNAEKKLVIMEYLLDEQSMRISELDTYINFMQKVREDETADQRLEVILKEVINLKRTIDDIELRNGDIESLLCDVMYPSRGV